MKQTAVDWLEEQIYSTRELDLQSVINQAKAMEKEHIKDAFNQSWHDRMNPYKTADKYYNKTFKSE